MSSGGEGQAGNKQGGWTQGTEKDTRGKNTEGKVKSLGDVLYAKSNTMSWSERRKYS